MKAGFSDYLYGKATLQIKPQIVFTSAFSTQSAAGLSFGAVLKIPISFTFIVGYDIDIIGLSDEFKLGPYELAAFSFKLLSTASQINEPQIRSITSGHSDTDVGHDVGAHILSNIPRNSVSCMCKSSNVTMAWQASASKATFTAKTTTWQIINGVILDTCDYNYTAVDVDSTSVLFTAPETSYYNWQSQVSAIAPESERNSWNIFARVGPGCCGTLLMCPSVSARNPTYTQSIFLEKGAEVSFVWSSNSAGSNAVIAMTISTDKEPVVYVDLNRGSDSNDGSHASPVEQLTKGLAILATKIGPGVTSATIFMYPTLYASGKIMRPSNVTGFVFPDVLKTVALTITSAISRKAISIFDAWKEQNYCNYQIKNCVSRKSFYDSVWGTSFDTGVYSDLLLEVLQTTLFCDALSEIWAISAGGRAFTLANFKSITLDGLWFQNFQSYGDGRLVHWWCLFVRCKYMY